MKYHFLLLLLLLVGCQETTTQNDTDNSREEKYNFQLSAEQIAVLNKQLSKGISGEIYDTDIETYTYSKPDLDATIPLLREILVKEGYQQPSETEFIAKVQQIFGRTIDPSKPTDYLFLNNWQPCEYVTTEKILMKFTFILIILLKRDDFSPNSLRYLNSSTIKNFVLNVFKKSRMPLRKFKWKVNLLSCINGVKRNIYQNNAKTISQN